ncbi:MAG TPA: hypothetical protein DEQ09_12635 [Bacteroidales bacterium]|nr:hypothetical protein [Bacteroidales bacterium]
MKTKLASIFVIFLILSSCSNPESNIDNQASLTGLSGDINNNLLFDNQDTQLLESPDHIRVFGEVKEEQEIMLSTLKLRSVVVKEVLPEDGKPAFKGTYRYDGYSLEDLLGYVELDKKSEFNPITDLYVKVHNSEGSYALISWAKIFYPVHHHLQLITTRVSRHVPYKTPDVQYPLPQKSKLVIGNDLLTCRNITNPVSIEVCSCQGDFPEIEMDRLFWPTLTLQGFSDSQVVLEELPPSLPEKESEMVFYGRGRGIHQLSPFKGCYLSDLLWEYSQPDQELLRTGYIIASSPDAYHTIFSVSEIMNRNDRLETLIIDEDNYEQAGQFSLVVSGDFFSDRAMKALSRIELRK